MATAGPSLALSAAPQIRFLIGIFCRVSEISDGRFIGQEEHGVPGPIGSGES